MGTRSTPHRLLETMRNDTELLDWWISTDPFDTLDGVDVHEVAAQLIDQGEDEEGKDLYRKAYRIVLDVCATTESARAARLARLLAEHKEQT